MTKTLTDARSTTEQPTYDPLDTGALIDFLRSLNIRLGDPGHVHLSYTVGDVSIDVTIHRFVPPTESEDGEEDD
jgi:hypothetical protein